MNKPCSQEISAYVRFWQALSSRAVSRLGGMVDRGAISLRTFDLLWSSFYGVRALLTIGVRR